MDTFDLMRTFVAVVDAGGFTAASHRLGRTKGVVSKYVVELEDRLGVRLLNRTTRQLALTEIGRVYYARAVDLIADLDALEAEIREQNQDVRGALRISAPRLMGERMVGRAVAEFLMGHPEVTAELVLTDRFVEPVEEGFDVLIRVADLPDTSLIARRVSPVASRVIASTAYLAGAGRPQSPRDLSRHSCVIDTNLRQPTAWAFTTATGGREIVQISGRLKVNGALAVREAVIAGAGIGLVPEFVLDGASADRIEELFAGAVAGDAALYVLYPHRKHLSAKVRSFVDFFVAWFATHGWDAMACGQTTKTLA